MTQSRSWNVKTAAGSRNRRVAMLVAGVSMVVVCAVVRHYWGADSANAEPAQSPAQRVATASSAERPAKTQPAAASRPAARETAAAEAMKVVAEVNSYRITREEFGRECLRHYGEAVLESMVNKYLIAEECKRQGIAVTNKEVDEEIERMASRFSLPVDQWLKMLKSERGINPSQYAADIIWPTLALRRLAGEQLRVTHEEMVRAYETQYGDAVRARLIACKDLEKAKQIRAEVAAKPDAFGDVAKRDSEDVPSAAMKGLIQPIRKHGTYEEIERAVFSMADGEISPVIQAGGQYVILKREALLPGARAVAFEKVAPQLEEMIRDGKTRKVADSIFQQLQREAKVENVFNDPARSRQMPGVAALVNGRQITVADLAEACIERHGDEVLEGTINRKLIEMACREKGITVSEQEIDEEIARVAAASVPPKPDGSPDVDAWLKLATEQQGVSPQIYRYDSVWPSVALRKLVGQRVDITPEDLRKGFEANYGPRVRCRAIVMGNLRRANQVWEMARENLTAEYFGDLAEQYSTEPQSRALRGVVPPIKKYGGQPLLEQEAFSLKPGELSSVVQVGEMYVILFCEGYTKPADVTFEQVQDYIREDLREKKLRITMAECFEQLKESATIENYVAGTSHQPKAKAPLQPVSSPPALKQVSAQK